MSYPNSYGPPARFSPHSALETMAGLNFAIAYIDTMLEQAVQYESEGHPAAPVYLQRALDAEAEITWCDWPVS